MKKKALTPAEREAAEYLYADLDYAYDNIDNDYTYDYLTVNEGRDGKTYVHYLSETKEAAIEIESLLIVDDEEELEELFY